jgi:hypothetical protein
MAKHVHWKVQSWSGSLLFKLAVVVWVVAVTSFYAAFYLPKGQNAPGIIRTEELEQGHAIVKAYPGMKVAGADQAPASFLRPQASPKSQIWSVWNADTQQPEDKNQPEGGKSVVDTATHVSEWMAKVPIEPSPSAFPSDPPLPSPPADSLPVTAPLVQHPIDAVPPSALELEAPDEEDHGRLRWRPLPSSPFSSSLNQLSFDAIPQIAYDTNTSATRRRAHLRYGNWRMKFPRFIRLSHVLWWQWYDFTGTRRNLACGIDFHPELSGIGTALGANIPNPADIIMAKNIVVGDLGHDPVPSHDGYYSFCEFDYTAGEVSVLNDVVVAHPSYDMHPCSHGSNVNALINMGRERVEGFQGLKQVKSLFWGYATAAPFFQHWTQNILPKLAQASLVDDSMLATSFSRSKWVANQELLTARFPIVPAIYDYMGWQPAMDEGVTPLHVDKLLYSCKSPPLHPVLWRIGQQKVLQIKEKPVQERKKLVYCGRNRAALTENEGRRVLNEPELLSLLSEWSRDGGESEVVMFDHSVFTAGTLATENNKGGNGQMVKDLVDFWGDARALIGPHGGCFTNVLFMPPNGLVVEAFPLVGGALRTTRGYGHMMYMQSMFLEHEYWMLPSLSSSSTGDFRMEINELCEILVKSLGPPPGKDATFCDRPYVSREDYLDYVHDAAPPPRPES